jgi:hypothetical protein
MLYSKQKLENSLKGKNDKRRRIGRLETTTRNKEIPHQVRDDTTLFLSLETLRFCVTLFLAFKEFTDFKL